MADKTNTSDAGAVAGEKKKRRAQGPRKPTELAVVVRVTDENNNPIPNARLDIISATKDISSAFRTFKENPGSDMTTFTVSNSKTEVDATKAA